LSKEYFVTGIANSGYNSKEILNNPRVIDTYLFLSLSDCIMITTKITQLVIIRVLHHFVVIGPIRFHLRVCYYFGTIIRILTNLSVFRILSITFATELRFSLFLFHWIWSWYTKAGQ